MITIKACVNCKWDHRQNPTHPTPCYACDGGNPHWEPIPTGLETLERLVRDDEIPENLRPLLTHVFRADAVWIDETHLMGTPTENSVVQTRPPNKVEKVERLIRLIIRKKSLINILRRQVNNEIKKLGKNKWALEKLQYNLENLTHEEDFSLIPVPNSKVML